MRFKKLLLLVMLVAIISEEPVFAQTSKIDKVNLLIIELVLEEGKGSIHVCVIPLQDDSMTNPDFKLLEYKWFTTAQYWINPSNRYGLSDSSVVATIIASADSWDGHTSYVVFSYMGTTKSRAGKHDGYNVISWGRYKRNIISVTYFWYTGSQILETDTMMNTMYTWSLSGEAGKFDVQNIITHELGHWCGLGDLTKDADYWLTMYASSAFGEIYKRTLGLGDILGVQAVYGL